MTLHTAPDSVGRSADSAAPRPARDADRSTQSLDGLVADAVTRDREWKNGAFRNQADGSFDTFPQETQ